MHEVDGQTLRAGIGLHVGTVMYGNIGSSDRLDFTVIGPAVNLAFRLESLTKELGHPVLASHAFAEAAAEPLASLGPHPIRGFRGLEVVFGLQGVGKLTYDALQSLDLPVIMATVMYASFFVVGANALVDLTYVLLDPRVRRR